MSERKPYYVLMRFYQGYSTPADDDGTIGGLFVFDTRENAEKFSPGSQVLEVREVSELQKSDNTPITKG